ncbi:hypothetical protein, partial [Escherichia coli]|uniref:hypothetical protein n=1 Tax=Escherichia coli TaxID=562 RepID=UPI00195E0DCE
TNAAKKQFFMSLKELEKFLTSSHDNLNPEYLDKTRCSKSGIDMSRGAIPLASISYRYQSQSLVGTFSN